MVVWTLVLKGAKSKGGIAGIAIFLLVVMGIYYNVKIAGIQAFNAIEVSNLKKNLSKQEITAEHYKRRDRVCQVDIVSLKDEIMIQNDQVADMRADADARAARAAAEAVVVYTAPEELERKVSRDYGYNEMNLFIAEVFGEGVL